MAAENQVDTRDGLRQRAVVGEVLMRQRHDHVGPLRLEPLDRGGRRGDRGREGDVLAGRGQHGGVGREQPEEADPVAAHLHHVQIDRADRRLAVAAEDVGTQPRECRLAHALRRDLGAEVELVIAEHRDVGAEQIVQLDHLRALGDAGQHRGRDQVAAEGGDAVRGRRPLPLQQGGQLGEAAAPLLRRDLVHVVGVQHRDPDRIGERAAPEQEGQRRTRDHGEPTLWN